MMLQRAPQFLYRVQRLQHLQQAQLRLRSTTHADVQHVETVTKPADWDSAKPYSEIPGPKSYPFVGPLRSFLPGGDFYNLKLEDHFKKLSAYGAVSKMSAIMGQPDVVLLSDPKLIEIAFRNEGPWPIRIGQASLTYYFENLRKGLPKSLAVSQGKEWQDFRTAVNQVMMQPKSVKQYVEPIDNVSQEFIDRMRRIRDKDSMMPANYQDELAKWALESITLVALDAKLGCLEDTPNPEGLKMIESAHIVFDSLYKLDVLPSPWKWISTPTWRRFVKAMNNITEISNKYIVKSMEQLKSLPTTEIKERNYSVLENILIKSGNPDRAVAMALDMMLGGIDTTSTVVATILYQVATHPEKQKKLQEELDKVIPDPSKPITKTQMEELKYMRACIKETMRVMPIFIGNTRITVKDLVLGGYQIPAGTMVSTSHLNLCTDEENFPRAKEFLPERWLAEGAELKATNPFSFLPFGFGPRMCVGRRFAEVEIETIVAKIFRNFKLEWNHPPPNVNAHLVLAFTDPLRFKVTDRV